MTIAIVIFMCLGYLLISTEHVTRINKATVALFCGVCGWVMYMCVAPSYVENQHASAFASFLQGEPFSITAVNRYVYDNVFSPCMIELTGVVLYLLATMAIVDVLNANGCFGFITTWCRSRNTHYVVWMLAFISFVLSANLDNLTASVIMLMALQQLVINPRQRMFLGSVIVIATNCGGCFTVIGDVSSLLIWTRHAVTPTNYSAALCLPAIVATIVPTFLISRNLPNTIDLKHRPSYYRGDAEELPVWQRIVMLFLGIAGLWFVPTFYRLTSLPPFLGALCVLGVLWVLNEIFNRKRIQSNQPMTVSEGRSMQFAMMQTIMFFMGVGLCINLLIEVGATQQVALWCHRYLSNIYILSLIMGFISAFLDNVALVISAASLSPILELKDATSPYLQNFVQNGSYWHLISLCGCVGGCLLPIGNCAGYTLMKSQGVKFWWYVHHITVKVLLGWLLALGTYFLVDSFLR